MNWVDILLLVILGAALVWGLRTGILVAVFAYIGVLAGCWLAGRYADDVGGLAGSVASADSLITAVTYGAIIALAAVVVAKIGSSIRPVR